MPAVTRVRKDVGIFLWASSTADGPRGQPRRARGGSRGCSKRQGNAPPGIIKINPHPSCLARQPAKDFLKQQRWTIAKLCAPYPVPPDGVSRVPQTATPSSDWDRENPLYPRSVPPLDNPVPRGGLQGFQGFKVLVRRREEDTFFRWGTRATRTQFGTRRHAPRNLAPIPLMRLEGLPPF